MLLKWKVDLGDKPGTTVIITRQDGSRVGKIWLSLHGAWRGTVCFTEDETEELRTLLAAARAARPRR